MCIFEDRKNEMKRQEVCKRKKGKFLRNLLTF